MDRAVGIRRSVMQDERAAILILFEHFPIELVALPFFETLGFLRGQVSPHREIRVRQVHSIFVIVSHLRPSISMLDLP